MPGFHPTPFREVRVSATTEVLEAVIGALEQLSPADDGQERARAWTVGQLAQECAAGRIAVVIALGTLIDAGRVATRYDQAKGSPTKGHPLYYLLEPSSGALPAFGGEVTT